MKIPPDAVIPAEKLVQYLLKARAKNDKSRFLAQAGFSQTDPDTLEQALRLLITESGAVIDRQDAYGEYYRVDGLLRGPSGILRVATIWMRRHGDEIVRFVTLKPLR